MAAGKEKISPGSLFCGVYTQEAPSGFSPLLGTRDGKRHTQKGFGTHACHQCSCPHGASETAFWTQSALEFCQQGRACPLSHNRSSPHLVNSISEIQLGSATSWPTPLAALIPALISPLNYHHIPSTSSLTSPSSVATDTRTFLKSNQIKHSPALYFSNALNFHNRGFSDSVGLRIWINLAPPWENPSWWGSWVQECTFSVRSPGDGELAMFTFRGAFIAPEQYMKREVRDWEDQCPSESRDQHRLLQRGFSWLYISNLGSFTRL